MSDEALAVFWSVTGLEKSQDIEKKLGEMLDKARQTYPELAITPSDFMNFLGKRYKSGDLAEFLAELDAAELYLIAACDAGEQLALQRFDREYLNEVRVGASRLNVSQADLEDITQEVRRLLLTPEPDGSRKLTTVSARGNLRALIRLIAFRAGVSMLRKQGRDQPLHESMFELEGSDESPSLVFLKEQHRELFAQALKHALDQLDVRSRTALKLHCLDGMTFDQLATMFKVDRSTVIRWIARSKKQILTDTRQYFHLNQGISRSHFESFIDVIRSNFDVNLRQLLKNSTGSLSSLG